MRMAKFLTAVAVASLATAPVIAAPASKLSVAQSVGVKASSKSGKSNQLGGGFILPLLALLAIIGGGIAISQGDDEPDSP
jgi:hypothetical protein